ncbi:hypothetical protein BSL78_17800 [Apostichopus japonicus]|uniref:Uncharacterized protein n=1 Tax=Stichopus japonicus TaxID=307972 RepID=A0A2G8KBI1_STIJA|nr:hypothetical protein BSL78_17800 [Apostichopus japonicus]
MQPYTKPLKATVVAIAPPKEFINNNGEKKSMILLGLANSEKVFKASLYNSKMTCIKEGSTLAVKNYITKPDGSLIFLTQPLQVPSKLKEEAYSIVHPPEAELMAISKAASSPVKTPVFLKGFITQVLDRPSDERDFIITAVTPQDDQLELLVEDQEHTLKIATNILKEYLGMDDNSEDDSLEEIVGQLPITVKAKVRGMSIVALL